MEHRDVNAEPQTQLRLLDLAAVDAEMLRLRHRRRTLPEDKELDRLAEELRARKDEAVGKEIRLDDLDRDIKRHEKELAQVRMREEKDTDLQRGGTLPAKQLTELQHELDSLARRKSIIEDETLEVMEQREAAEADLQHAGAQVSHVESQIAEVKRHRDEALADIETAERRCTTDRNAIAGSFPADLLALYDSRVRAGGLGAGVLNGGKCGACRIELDRGELARINAAPAERVLQCPECDAILVRK